MSPSIVKHPPQHLHEDLRQLSLVTLTTQNKYALMQGAIDASKGSMENAEALLARMEHFDASAAREFGLKEVAVSRAPLRLLRTPTTWDNTIVSLKRTFGASKNGKEMSFLTRSSSTSDTKFKSFIALSYCWHSDDWALAPQCRRVGDMPISPILLRALFDQRKSVDEGVWIDACCIDQANETEKMQAIGSMDVIFKSARLVVIVLEDVFLSSEEADFVRSLPTKLDELICQRAFLPSMHRSLVRILLCRWFTRSWYATSPPIC